MGLREYDYIRGNTATIPERKHSDWDRQKQRENDRREKERKAQKVRKNRIVTMISMVGIGVVLGTVTLLTNGIVYKLQKDLSATETAINEQVVISEALRVDMLQYASFAGIKDTAEKELGMVYPTADSAITIDMSKEYFAHLNESESGENTFFTKLKDWFN